MLTITVAAESSASPERVLEAGRDFSPRRADVWSNVRANHLEVHDSGENFADVTEGTWSSAFSGSGADTTGRNPDQ